ncbi:hypothetical protein NDU88_002826 [Pleurodeles waltl]|uniref:Cadherin domain-containing protein n=1 Tax=Pleurodeles waltl TaxID=8319 RepID=A0AAV7SFV1_PLEWA|nr:hypothetical protein NDU88_002826 [Pleurodeles waltl]
MYAVKRTALLKKSEGSILHDSEEQLSRISQMVAPAVKMEREASPADYRGHVCSPDGQGSMELSFPVSESLVVINKEVDPNNFVYTLAAKSLTAYIVDATDGTEGHDRTLSLEIKGTNEAAPLHSTVKISRVDCTIDHCCTESSNVKSVP